MRARVPHIRIYEFCERLRSELPAWYTMGTSLGSFPTYGGVRGLRGVLVGKIFLEALDVLQTFFRQLRRFLQTSLMMKTAPLIFHRRWAG